MRNRLGRARPKNRAIFIYFRYRELASRRGRET
jgi:hypothetical protein